MTAPCLVFDVGDNFTVHHAAAVNFRLICPGYRRPPLKVTALLSENLDPTGWKEAPELHQEEEGVWAFTEVFSLFGRGRTECDPGTHRITIEVAFPEAPKNSPGPLLKADIRFKVPDPNVDGDRTLKIEADGLGLVNVQGLNTAGFDKVEIKAGDKSVVNLAQTVDLPALGTASAEPPGSDSPEMLRNVVRNAADRHFVVPLRKRMNARSLFVSDKYGPLKREKLRLTFQRSFGGGVFAPRIEKQVLLYATDDRRLGFGRRSPGSYDPSGKTRVDICLRYVPGSNQGTDEQFCVHDDHSKTISGFHFDVELTRDGARIRDVGSNNGTHVGGRKLEPGKPVVLGSGPDNAADDIQVADIFHLRAHTFRTPADRPAALAPPGKEHTTALKRIAPPIYWTFAQQRRLEAMRFDRLSNLTTEQYVWVLHQALIGSANDCAIQLPDDVGIDHLARVLHDGENYWLQRIVPDGQIEVQVNGEEIACVDLIPLVPGQVWNFGSKQNQCVVQEAEQDLSGYPARRADNPLENTVLS
jgi:hypothetical protein